jgi:hypothetical protein
MTTTCLRPMLANTSEMAARFGIASASLRTIQNQRNLVCEGLAEGRPCILKVIPGDRSTPGLLLGEADWMRHLRAQVARWDNQAHFGSVHDDQHDGKLLDDGAELVSLAFECAHCTWFAGYGLGAPFPPLEEAADLFEAMYLWTESAGFRPQVYLRAQPQCTCGEN